MTKVYLATPIESAARDKKEYLAYAEQVAGVLKAFGYEVHCPWTVHIPNAWDLPNDKWGDEVAKADIEAIKNSDLVCCVCYDRSESTPGMSWELGFAYGLNKPTLIIEHESVKVMSLLFSYASTYQVRGLSGLKDLLMCYDDKYNTPPKYRGTEVK